MVTRIKICGITNREDARAAIQMGADALGFIFVPGTPRCVAHRSDLSDLLEFLDSVPPFIARVGVCREPGEIPAEALTRLDFLQTYDHSCLTESTAGPAQIPAFRLKSETDVTAIGAVLSVYRSRAILLDAYHETQLGGGGVKFDWGLAELAKRLYGVPVILAGGLNEANVAQAILEAAPYAVDVASGVEIEAYPGRKDLVRMRHFIDAVRSASSSLNSP